MGHLIGGVGLITAGADEDSTIRVLARSIPRLAIDGRDRSANRSSALASASVS
jgi:hypothetical protein